MKEKKDLQPFFSKFLENLMDTSDEEAVKGGKPPFITEKYPSDDDG